MSTQYIDLKKDFYMELNERVMIETNLITLGHFEHNDFLDMTDKELDEALNYLLEAGIY
jgi:hypothetical protein